MVRSVSCLPLTSNSHVFMMCCCLFCYIKNNGHCRAFSRVDVFAATNHTSVSPSFMHVLAFLLVKSTLYVAIRRIVVSLDFGSV